MKTRVALLALAVALAACGKVAQNVAVQDPAADTACALDGMLLMDHPGPKAQIHYAEGKPDYFCDLAEIFGLLQAPEQKRVVAAVYVQDMGKADWAHPQGHWVEARAAYFVVGSRKEGSMGPAIGSFAAQQDAQAFAAKEGGKVVRFDEVKPDMLRQGGAARDDDMSH